MTQHVMEPASSTRSGRPSPGEFVSYAADDIAFVEGDDATTALSEQAALVEKLFEPLTDAAVSGRRYAPGKWTVKEVLGHMVDDERIFAYRLLCVARADTRALPGFDEKEYVAATQFESQTLTALLSQYRAVRNATLSLLASLRPDEWDRRGEVNGYSATVRGLAFHIAGHELRHYRALRQLYLADL